jgi:hypothetical protein
VGWPASAPLDSTELDLSHCWFAEVLHLDQLRLEGRCVFADTPGWVRGTRWRVPVWRYARRQTLYEECVWRHGRGSWRPTAAEDIDANPPLAAERLAALYRQLRKAHEDAKNEPGAADFYLSGLSTSPSPPCPAGRWGIERQACLGRVRGGARSAVEHSLDSATSLLRTAREPALTGFGQVLEVLLRLLGPLLLGLAVLAVRNRVRR